MAGCTSINLTQSYVRQDEKGSVEKELWGEYSENQSELFRSAMSFSFTNSEIKGIPLETAELLGTTRWTEARSDDCVADDRTVQYLIRNLI